MRDSNRPAHNQSDGHGLIEFSLADFFPETAVDMISDTIIAAQDHRGHQPQHLFDRHRKRALRINRIIQREKSFYMFVLSGKNELIEPFPFSLELIQLGRQ